MRIRLTIDITRHSPGTTPEPEHREVDMGTAFSDAPDHHEPEMHADHPRRQEQLFPEDVRRVGFTGGRA